LPATRATRAQLREFGVVRVQGRLEQRVRRRA
jgi:hypothetical protein